VTNIGWIIVTLEFDCSGAEQFETLLSWTRGKDDDFKRAPFSKVHAALQESREYIGYSIVFSGGRSLQFHLIFSITHLRFAPWDIPASERWAGDPILVAALLQQAHETYWDFAEETFKAVLDLPCSIDRAMRKVIQWRRSPWAMRALDKDYSFLGLELGMKVPQLVIREDIRQRAFKAQAAYLVEESFQPSPRSAKVHSATGQIHTLPHGIVSEMIPMMQEILREEFGSEFPKPVSVSHRNDQWTINFKNHEGDQHPTTYVSGSYRRLDLLGRHNFEKDFYLPDHMSADGFCSFVGAHCGAIASIGSPIGLIPASSNSLEGKEQRDQLPPPFKQLLRSFRKTEITDEPRAAIIDRYRQKAGHILDWTPYFPGDALILGTEGLGKSTAMFRVMATLMADQPDPCSTGKRLDSARHGSFFCFACRSEAQAAEKAKEFRKQTGLDAVVIHSFWKYYDKACIEAEVEPLEKTISRNEIHRTYWTRSGYAIPKFIRG